MTNVWVRVFVLNFSSAKKIKKTRANTDKAFALVFLSIGFNVSHHAYNFAHGLAQGGRVLALLAQDGKDILQVLVFVGKSA